MICKKCGVELPKSGFVCTNCGVMMSAEQMKEQKERMKLNENHFQQGYVAEQYGLKKMLFQKREEKKSFGLLFFFLGFFVFVLLLVLFVYFR